MDDNKESLIEFQERVLAKLEKGSSNSNQHMFLCATSAGLSYLFDVMDIIEIIPMSGVVTRIPRAPSGVVGAINVRGRLITVHRASKVCSNTIGDDAINSVLVVHQRHGLPIGFAVSSVLGFVEAELDDTVNKIGSGELIKVSMSELLDSNVFLTSKNK